MRKTVATVLAFLLTVPGCERPNEPPRAKVGDESKKEPPVLASAQPAPVKPPAPEPAAKEEEKYLDISQGPIEMLGVHITLSTSEVGDFEKLKNAARVSLLVSHVDRKEPLILQGWDSQYVKESEKTGDLEMSDPAKAMRMNWIRVTTDTGVELKMLGRGVSSPKSSKVFGDYRVDERNMAYIRYEFEKPPADAKWVRFSLPPREFSTVERTLIQIPIRKFKPKS